MPRRPTLPQSTGAQGFGGGYSGGTQGGYPGGHQGSSQGFGPGQASSSSYRPGAARDWTDDVNHERVDYKRSSQALDNAQKSYHHERDTRENRNMNNASLRPADFPNLSHLQKDDHRSMFPYSETYRESAHRDGFDRGEFNSRNMDCFAPHQQGGHLRAVGFSEDAYNTARKFSNEHRQNGWTPNSMPPTPPAYRDMPIPESDGFQTVRPKHFKQRHEPRNNYFPR